MLVNLGDKGHVAAQRHGGAEEVARLPVGGGELRLLRVVTLGDNATASTHSGEHDRRRDVRATLCHMASPGWLCSAAPPTPLARKVGAENGTSVPRGGRCPKTIFDR